MSELIITHANEFYNFIKGEDTLKQEPEIKEMISLIESLDKVCGCSRGTLNERIQGIFTRMLPIVQVRNPDYFDNLKEKLKVSRIIFKEGELTLLIV